MYMYVLISETFKIYYKLSLANSVIRKNRISILYHNIDDFFFHSEFLI